AAGFVQRRQELVAHERIVARQPVPVLRLDARQAIDDFDVHERETRESANPGMLESPAGCVRRARADDIEDSAKLESAVSRTVLERREPVLSFAGERISFRFCGAPVSRCDTTRPSMRPGSRRVPMKKIEAIFKPFKLDEVREALSEIGVSGLT